MSDYFYAFVSKELSIPHDIAENCHVYDSCLVFEGEDLADLIMYLKKYKENKYRIIHIHSWMTKSGNFKNIPEDLQDVFKKPFRLTDK